MAGPAPAINARAGGRRWRVRGVEQTPAPG